MNARRQRAMSPRTSYCSLRSLLLRVHYESDGGPGIGSIMRLLRDGDNPGEDQHAFITAVITFWLLGAIDGHAKNFSVFLSPGCRYRMTPLYDVVSAQPNVEAREIRRNQFRLAGRRRQPSLPHRYDRTASLPANCTARQHGSEYSRCHIRGAARYRGGLLAASRTFSPFPSLRNSQRERLEAPGFVATGHRL